MPLILALLLSAELPRLAVLDVKARGNVSTQTTQIAGDLLTTSVRERAPGYSVLGAEDLRQMVALQKHKIELGCDATAVMACLAEIGGAVGAERVVQSTLDRLDEAYTFLVELVDTRHSRVLASAHSRSIGLADADLIDAIRSGVRDLFRQLDRAGVLVPSTEATRTERRTPQPRADGRTAAPWTLLVGGAAVAVAGGILGGVALGIWAGDHPTPLSTGGTQHTISRSDANLANGLATGSIILLPVGALAAAGGLTWLGLAR